MEAGRGVDEGSSDADGVECTVHFGIVEAIWKLVGQCSTWNSFLTGTGNGNGNGKKCRERE